MSHMSKVVKPEVVVLSDSRGRGYGSKGPITDPTIELRWPDGGVCVRQNTGPWFYKDKGDGHLVLAQEPEQRLWNKIAGKG